MADETMDANQTSNTPETTNSQTSNVNPQASEVGVGPAKSNKSTIIIAIIIILLVIALGWYLFKGKNVENNDTASGVTGQPENANDDAIPTTEISAADNTNNEIDVVTFSEDALNDLG